MQNINTERLTLRLLDHNDAPMIVSLLNEPAFIQNIGDKDVNDIAGAKAYINNGPLEQFKRYNFCLLCVVVKESNTPIGLCGLIKRDGIEHPEIGYALLQAHHGKGYAFEAANGVLAHVKQKQSMSVLQAICNPDNKRSINLLAKLGFERVKEIFLPPQKQKVVLFECAL
ncbi:GNAT family N-acetyltransferase [Thalassotalea sediminis]|uniref:GNAT family N-acetyltransferase n=1 Tax=Thalassotalea sediminis TaxID=1759089 RepID=UPI0025745AB2|nr:GNAT family N-acetyltransferase [Thalassotalea sediminis]